ncbi:MAG: tetratricopeptide repeat protein, partial [Bacteroidota bacterium]
MIDEKSIAVLPFANMSSDPENEYFSDGMTEEIINALSRIEGLKVTARTSSFVFKNRKADVRKIGQELGVSLVLEGSVRKAGDRLRITAQLIRTEDGFHIWSENFDRQLLDVFALQDEVSLLIADKIREHFGHFPLPDHLVDAPTKNMEAYQYYLKGRYYHNKWSMEGFRQAAEYYQQSIARDPNFALPYFGAGLSYSFLGSWAAMDKSEAFQKVDELFAQGRLLDPSLPYGYFCQAKHLFWGLWEDQKSEVLLQKALQANPRDANNNEFMAEILSRQGEFAQAQEYIDISLNVSPLAPNHYYSKANIFYLQGQFEEALVVIEKGLSIAADFAILIELKLACLIQLGRK